MLQKTLSYFIQTAYCIYGGLLLLSYCIVYSIMGSRQESNGEKRRRDMGSGFEEMFLLLFIFYYKRLNFVVKNTMTIYDMI